MAKLTEEMKDFISSNLAWVATIGKDGHVDLGPKMSTFVIDDTHIGYHERTAGQMYRNLLDGSELVIAVANLEQKRGYRFRGNVTLHSDDAIYDEQVAVAEHNGTKKPMTIPVLEITEIQDLTPGATAGKTIVKDCLIGSTTDTFCLNLQNRHDVVPADNETHTPWKEGPERVSFFCQDKKS